MSLGFSYSIPRMRIIDYWERGITGEGIKVAVVDSGISPHRDLLVYGGTGIDDSGQILDYNFDNTGHGTHVAGIIAAKASADKGFCGIAPDVQLYSCKYSSNTKRDFLVGILHSIRWAIDEGVDILNLSLSITKSYIEPFGDIKQDFIDIFNELLTLDIIIICAAGNQGDGTENWIDRNGFIQNLPGVIVVGSIDYFDLHVPSSAKGSSVKLVGCGLDVLSCMRDNTLIYSSKYGLMSGTSMAVPQITGIFALYKQLFPNLSKNQLIQKVYANSKKIVGLTDNSQGFGVPQPPDELYNFTICKDYPNTYLRIPYGWSSCEIIVQFEGEYIEAEVMI